MDFTSAGAMAAEQGWTTRTRWSKVFTFACLLLLCGQAWLSSASAQANSAVLYSTKFESWEGFDTRYELVGQQGWIGEGTGGNGLITEAIPGEGQQAYIGFFPPLDTNDFTTVWRPVNFAPSAAAERIVRFFVTLQFIASTNGSHDDFRWSLYNTNGTRLFSIDFQTATRNINYILDDSNFVFTGLNFEFGGLYTLAVIMDFGKNSWTALVNDEAIVVNKAITTRQSPLSFGDMDAVWFLKDPARPGNNYMVFDNYRVITGRTFIEILGRESNGEFHFNVHGEPGLKYLIEVTDNFRDWFSLGTHVAPASGSFKFNDTTSPQHRASFYAVSQVP